MLFYLSEYEKNMKNILFLTLISIFIFGCNESSVNPIDKPEVPFEPTGFTLSMNDSIHLYCNNGKLDHLRGDTIKLNWYFGEKSFDINFLNSKGETLKNPDPLKYITFADIIEHSTKEVKRAFASAYNYTLSITPHDEGVAYLVFNLKKEGKVIVNQDSIPIVIYR